MAVQNGLITRASVKVALDFATSAHDDVIDRAIRDATRAIQDCIGGRRIIPWIGTRVFTPRAGGYLRVDDLISLTSLATDESGDRTYSTVWAATDYDLGPLNAAADGLPYSEISLAPNGLYSFPSYARGVQVTGVWGFPETLELSGSLLAEGLDASETAIDVDNGAHFQGGHIGKADSEWFHVDTISGNTLTTIRAFNGSTAAIHSDDTPVYLLHYPSFETAAMILVARLISRKNAPLGIVGSGEMASMIVRSDPDLLRLLDPYRHLVVA